MARSIRLSISSRPAASISSSSSAAAATVAGDGPRGALLREVPDEVDQIVRDARRARGRGWRSPRPRLVDLDLSSPQVRRTIGEERRLVVVVEPGLEREPRPQGRGQKPRPGRGSDQREAGQGQAHAAGVRTLVDHDIDPEVLHRRVEVLLDRLGDPVDLVDEEDVAFLEIGEQARQVAAFSITGPEVTRTFLPSSLPRMKARVVLPRPGGPESRM